MFCDCGVLVLQEYSEWKKESTDISLPGVYIGLIDCLNSFSRVIVDSTQELCSTIESSYIEKVKETCKNGEREEREEREAAVTASSERVHTCLKYSAHVSLLQ